MPSSDYPSLLLLPIATLMSLTLTPISLALTPTPPPPPSLETPLALPLKMFDERDMKYKEDGVIEVLNRKRESSPPFVLRDPSYLVVAPRLVRAGQVYRAVVNILEPSPPLVVRATIYRDNIELAAVEHECESDYPHALELMVPPGASAGRYRLRLEGNEIGSLTGSAFINETALTFSPRGATVLVQTDKPIYKQGDVVRFRVVALDTAVKMVEDAVDIFILSPTGVMVRRWLSRQCREGPVSLSFPLSIEPEFGEWNIRVEATNTFTQHSFHVELFNLPRFEVEIHTPAFLAADSPYLSGTVAANYSLSGAPVTGNITIRAHVRVLRDKEEYQEDRWYKEEMREEEKDGYRTVHQPAVMFAGIYHFKFLVSDLEAIIEAEGGGGGGGDGEVMVTALVGDAQFGTTHTSFALTRIFSSAIKLEFLGESPHILRPPMPFRFYLSATQHDGSRVPEWRLYRHRLHVTPVVRFYTGERRKLNHTFVTMTHARYALWEAEIDIHVQLGGGDMANRVESLWLEAELKDATGSKCRTSLVAVAHHSVKGQHLQVTTSTRQPKVGEYVILHVRSNYYLDHFRYILLSKGMVIEAGKQTMEASLKTFPLPLSPEVAGVATVVVYTIGRDEALVADALTFPVDALTRKGLHIDLRQDPADLSKLKVTVMGLPGSRVALSGTHWHSYSMQAGNDLTHAQVLYEMARDAGRVVQEPLEQKWVSQDGLPENILHLPLTTPAIDPNSTFTYADLLVLSDGPVPGMESVCRASSASKGQCLLGGCYSTVERCDGKTDCLDRIDEKGCGKRGTEEENLSHYRQHRTSRLSRHYSNPWIWEEVTIDDTSSATLSVPVPHGSVHLALTAFSLHAEKGLTILPEPKIWKGSVGFWIDVEAPSRVYLGEQIGIRVTAVNHGSDRVSAIIVLAKSRDYKFVDVNSFYQPYRGEEERESRVQGEHEHRVWVEGGEAHTLYLPISAVRTGDVRVTVQATLEDRKLSKEVVLAVEPPGITQDLHTSVLLDLNNRAYFFTFLDINTSKNAVPGSTQAHVSVFGDTVGPVTLASPLQQSAITLPTSDSLLGLPEGGSEPVAFCFLLTVLQLRYSNEMEQQPVIEEKEVFKDLSLLYQTILSYQNKDGGFKYFGSSKRSSVWVTCLVLRALNEVSNTWPHLLYVDPQVTDRAIRFILSHQAHHGAWMEPNGEVPDRKLVPALLSLSGQSTNSLNLSLTAHTIIELHSLRNLPSPLDKQVVSAVSKGRVWLENNLDLVGQVSRPLEVSLVALALHLSQSKQGHTAFGFLTRNARQEVKYVYWGEDKVDLPSYRVESQRPHLQPRQRHRHDSGNVAATSYALRLYTMRGEIMTPSIMRWLEAQRNSDGGWMSTQDTLAAWEALYCYSKHDSNARNTKLTITVEPLRNHTQAHTFHITPDNFLQLQTKEVSSSWGSLRIQGKGRGSAILQLTSEYNIEHSDDLFSPPTRAFHMNTHVSWDGRNGTSISYYPCVEWVFQEAGESSGVSVLEIGVPTGYGVTEMALDRLVKYGKVPYLRRAKFVDRKVVFFFDKLTGSKMCFGFSVERWFPVANLSRIIPVKVYEFYAPELYAIQLLRMPSASMDICQVCGSYQCPNCPILSYYSSGAWHQRGTLHVASIIMFGISVLLS